MNNKSIESRIEKVKAKIHEIEQDKKYGCWCRGYILKQFKDDLAMLEEQLNNNN